MCVVIFSELIGHSMTGAGFTGAVVSLLNHLDRAYCEHYDVLGSICQIEPDLMVEAADFYNCSSSSFD